jgi:uncharacterized membrane protein YecN with MAPEG domain
MPLEHLAVSGFYTALMALLFVAGEIVTGRREIDGLDLAARMRRRSEHVPFALLLLFILEMGGSSRVLLHCIGILLLAARAAAPLAGLARLPVTRLEQAGAFTTTGVTCAAALLVLVRALRSAF